MSMALHHVDSHAHCMRALVHREHVHAFMRACMHAYFLHVRRRTHTRGSERAKQEEGVKGFRVYSLGFRV
jgi:hypothetical protein